ncbi:MAG: GNAT family N-acetyltransferase [Streptosporangiales bacterium]|nr:GNAT family N-acetyltransferase [Streptosporangiales bacterium]
MECAAVNGTYRGRGSVKTMDVVVRRATVADRQAVERLLDGAGLPLAGLDDVWAAWVAERGGAVVGTVALERYRPDRHRPRLGRPRLGRPRLRRPRRDGGGEGADEPAYLLRSVAVDPALQGMGIGGTLVETALETADGDAGRTATVALLTDSAVGYFDQFGFTPVQRSALPTALAGSAELTGACPESARSYLRTGARVSG